MPTNTPSPTRVAAVAVARASRVKGRNSPEAIEARRDLLATKLLEYAHREVAKAPPLTDEQIDRIALALRGGR